MCLTIPYKIEEIRDHKAMVKKNNKKVVEIDIKLISGLKKGNWVLLLNNLAIEKISAQEAKAIINLYKYDKK